MDQYKHQLWNFLQKSGKMGCQYNCQMRITILHQTDGDRCQKDEILLPANSTEPIDIQREKDHYGKLEHQSKHIRNLRSRKEDANQRDRSRHPTDS